MNRITEINQKLDELEKKVLSEARLVATTLTKTFSAKQFPDIPFDVLIADEVSMAPLPHLYWAAGRCKDHVTVVGDFLQLPPICVAEKDMAQKWLGRSIFAVLGIETVEKACSDPRVTLLDTQYRMVPEISAIPNLFFYKNKLNDGPSTLSGKQLYDGISKKPLVLVETAQTNPWCSRLSTGGRFNLYSALVCATLAKRISEKVPNLKMGIATPYAAQARLINKIANDWKLLEHVRVSTVHRFQGGEEPIIIFDCVEGPGTRVAPMLDDTKDHHARLVLNVALTRAKKRFYFVGHTRHLLSDLHPDSALAMLVRYFYEHADIVDSENFVDNYFTSDFEKWASTLLPAPTSRREPVSADLYTERSFWAQFFQDLHTAKKSLILLSPFASLRRAGVLMDYFRVLRERGVDIRVYTRPASQQIGEMASQADIVIQQLRSIGAKVIERSKMHQKVAIIDDAIAWDGSLNILSHRDTEEHMWRFEAPSAINDIIKNLELEEENATGNITAEQCPKCGMPMVVRRSRYGTFLSCSAYPRCEGKMDITKTKAANAERICPNCGRPMVLRRGKKGAFLGCSGYPSCKTTMWL